MRTVPFAEVPVAAPNRYLPGSLVLLATAAYVPRTQSGASSEPSTAQHCFQHVPLPLAAKVFQHNTFITVEEELDPNFPDLPQGNSVLCFGLGLSISLAIAPMIASPIELGRFITLGA